MNPLDRLLSRLITGMLVRELRAAFRRVCWVGAMPALPAGVPVVLYANHHNYYDAHLLGFLVTQVLQRPALYWMAEWDRFPFLAAVGALPFPPGDPQRRSATLRRTIRRFRAQPETVLVYFPEGRLHPPEEGLLPGSSTALSRLDRLLPEKVWWPVALCVRWGNEARPTALLKGGSPHPTAEDGRTHDRLSSLWSGLHAEAPRTTRTLLEGKRGRSERWDFSFAQHFFGRFL